MVYECILQVRSAKSRFLRTRNSSTCRYEKAIMYPRNHSNGSKICTRPGQTLGKQSVSQNFFIFSGPSFIPKYSCGRVENYLPIFDRVEFQEEEEFKKSETHFGSLGPALPAGLSQILLTQTQGYIIAFEGGTLFNQ